MSLQIVFTNYAPENGLVFTPLNWLLMLSKGFLIKC